MNVLMLAPEPFFQPRGTPISVYFRIKALTELGHRVTLVTYPLGEDVTLRGLKISRIPRPFFIREIKVGPSLAKIPLDFLLTIKASSELAQNSYDLIFSHEEAALIGIFLGKIWKTPHVYDMHSSLPQQLENFRFSRSTILKRIFNWVEDSMLKHSQAVVVICQDLEILVRKKGWGKKAVLLENFLDFGYSHFPQEEVERKRREIAPKGEKIVLYAGNFQPYQGIELLLEAAALVGENVLYVLLGGERAEQERMKKKAESLRISSRVIFVDKVPPSVVPLYISIADVLVSPRLSGTNTPLKIYSFLKSGKPLVATNLWTHTQVLNSELSILVEPNSQSLAEGLEVALFDEEARRKAQRAKEMADRCFTYSVYLEKINEVLLKARENFRNSWQAR